MPGLALAVVNETEPNDTLTAADLVTFGDTVSGVINPANDVDYFAVDLTAGTVLDLDVDAAQVGSALDPVIALFDVDTFTVLAVNDDFDGLDSRIIYAVPADGRYFVGIVDYSFGGSASHSYTLRFGAFAVDEIEPNDTPGQATAIAMGDTASGTISPSTDLDYFALPVTGGSYVRAELESEFASALVLYGADGTTVLDSSDVYAEYPLRVTAPASATATWYLKVRSVSGNPTTGLYLLRPDSLATGPGDPTTVFASGVTDPVLSVADATGGLYVLGGFGSAVYHVTAGGAVSTEATGTFFASGLAIDGFGDLLLAAFGFSSGRTGVFRLGAGGTLSLVHEVGSLAGGLAVGPDGDIWVGACLQTACPALRRLSPLGELKSTIATTTYPVYIKFSPGGVLHFSDAFSTIFRLNGSTVQSVLTAAPYVEDFAFDTDGYLYVGNGYLGQVSLYSPTYQPVHMPFAGTNLGGPLSLTFLRTAAGAMTARMLVTADGYLQSPPYLDAVLEVNPAGVRAVGARVGVDLLTITTAALPAGSVGADYAVTLEVASPPGGLAWSVVAGTLPPGLSLDATSGVIGGIPTAAGASNVTIRVDGGGRLGLRQFSMQVTTPAVTVSAAMDAAMGVPDALTIEEKRYLDIVGNNNGLFDIGDLRALLRRERQLSRAAMLEASTPGGRN
jgi:hypothetical protein